MKVFDPLSMGYNDVGDETCWRQVLDVGDDFNYFGHYRNSVTNIQKLLQTASHQHDHVTNITVCTLIWIKMSTLTLKMISITRDGSVLQCTFSVKHVMEVFSV